MRSEVLNHQLQRGDLRARLTGGEADVVIGIGRDPDDARRNCVMLYVPPEFVHPTPDFLVLRGERVRVVKRERRGPLLAYAG